MASLATLKINSYFFIGMMFLVFGVFIAAVGLLLQVPVGFLAVIFLFIVIFQILISSTVVKWTTRTRYIKKGEVPYLEEMVERVAKKADIPPPKIGIVDDPTPNAFVFGLTQGGSSLSVHRGLLEQLTDEEIEAVIGHEIGHIKNRDCMYMTILSVMPLIAYYGMHLFLVARFGGRSKDNAQAMLILLAIAAISAVVYFLTSLLIKRLSRIREYFADAYSAHITEDPHALASALTKITYGLSLAPQEVKAKNAARQFYIGNVQHAHKEMDRIMRNKSKYDLDGDGVIDENELELAMTEEAKRSGWDSFSGLFATHPPTFKRILALKEMEKEMTEGRMSIKETYDRVEF
jgi:heat shock protein HtpX